MAAYKSFLESLGGETVQTMSSITRISKNVTRVLGQNPGKFTLDGTNTYLVGQRNPYILVDSGEGRSTYITQLEAAMKESTDEFRTEEADISDIILTHRHRDHCGGLHSVLTLLQKRWAERHGESRPFPAPRIHKFPYSHPEVDGILRSLPRDALIPRDSDVVSHPLSGGQVFNISAPSDPSSDNLILEVIETPGHTPDSICLYLPADRAIFTGDTILGQSSSVFEDLSTYMSSLRKLNTFAAELTENGEPRCTTLYPGHGPVVPHDHVAIYLKHRIDRETQIVKVLNRAPPSSEHWTTWTIVRDIYRGLPANMAEAAAQSVALHLLKLESEGRVERAGGHDHHTQWRFHFHG